MILIFVARQHETDGTKHASVFKVPSDVTDHEIRDRLVVLCGEGTSLDLEAGLVRRPVCSLSCD